MTEVGSLKSEDSRKEWLEHSVMPALLKLAVYDPAYIRGFLDRLKGLID
jgi:hypothetical protein